MENIKYDVNGFVVLDENIPAMVADVLRMRAGSEKFKKKYGESTQRTTVDATEAYQKSDKKSSIAEKIFNVLGAVAVNTIPVVVSKITGVNLSFMNGLGFDFNVFFR